MRNQTNAFDYARIIEQIEEILRSNGLSLQDFLHRMRSETNAGNECCPGTKETFCCHNDGQLFGNFDEFDWET